MNERAQIDILHREVQRLVREIGALKDELDRRPFASETHRQQAQRLVEERQAQVIRAAHAEAIIQSAQQWLQNVSIGVRSEMGDDFDVITAILTR